MWEQAGEQKKECKLKERRRGEEKTRKRGGEEEEEDGRRGQERTGEERNAKERTEMGQFSKKCTAPRREHHFRCSREPCRGLRGAVLGHLGFILGSWDQPRAMGLEELGPSSRSSKKQSCRTGFLFCLCWNWTVPGSVRAMGVRAASGPNLGETG